MDKETRGKEKTGGKSEGKHEKKKGIWESESYQRWKYSVKRVSARIT